MQAEDIELLSIVSLGGGNHGTIGPQGDAQTAAQQTTFLGQEVARAAYRKRPTNRWICVDGRVSAQKMVETGNVEADPQTAGGMPLTEVAVDFMLQAEPAPMSEALAEATKLTIQNGQKAVIHGDTHGGKNGCGCNKSQREILQSNAENIDIVTPILWAVGSALKLDTYITVADITQLVTIGGQNADKDALWDVTPEQKVEILLENGGEYEELVGGHTECITRIGLDDMAFDETAFIRDHAHEDGNALGVFNVTAGLLKEYYFEHVADQREAALRTMAALLHNAGTAKWLSNDNMRAALIAPAS